MSSKPIPVVDLFAGPGGLGEGFSKVMKGAAFKVVVSIEKDPATHKTLRLRSFYRALLGSFGSARKHLHPDFMVFLKAKNKKEQDAALKSLAIKFPKEWEHADSEALCLTLGEHNRTINDKIKEALGNNLDKNNKDWVLIGGPPCQAYSLVGRSRTGNHDGMKKDPRQMLYKEYLGILRRYKPTVFVMENVKGINSAKVAGVRILPRIEKDLRRSGYTLQTLSHAPSSDTDYLLKAEDYGVPQTRHRVIIIGRRKDRRIARLNPLRPLGGPVTTFHAIDDLPQLSALHSEDPGKNIGKKAGATFAKFRKTPRGGLHAALKKFTSPPCQELTKVVLNHEARSHMESDIKRYQWWSETAAILMKGERSPNLDDIPARKRKILLPNHANLKSGMPKVFADRFKVQVSEKPSGTITSHISKDGHYYIHYSPTQARSFSVREAARIQTFPDDYFFMGNRTQQYHQVGNAVPPYLAYQIGQRVWEALRHNFYKKNKV
jgi:DNA (cytosine-5)-methyltransferase 1